MQSTLRKRLAWMSQECREKYQLPADDTTLLAQSEEERKPLDASGEYM